MEQKQKKLNLFLNPRYTNLQNRVIKWATWIGFQRMCSVSSLARYRVRASFTRALLLLMAFRFSISVSLSASGCENGCILMDGWMADQYYYLCYHLYYNFILFYIFPISFYFIISLFWAHYRLTLACYLKALHTNHLNKHQNYTDT